MKRAYLFSARPGPPLPVESLDQENVPMMTKYIGLVSLIHQRSFQNIQLFNIMGVRMGVRRGKSLAEFQKFSIEK